MSSAPYRCPRSPPSGPSLTPEFPVYGSTETDTHEEATEGIVDAIAFDEDGAPQVVIDWKSDVDPFARDPSSTTAPRSAPTST